MLQNDLLMNQKKILLAEDDEDDQHLFVDYLQERKDIELLPIVENGVDLHQYLEASYTEKGLPDIIILDQNMPKLNGLETLKKLKLRDEFNSIPVIIYSTYTDNQLVKKGLESGAFMVLVKPITKTGYNEMIETILEGCIRS